MAAAAGLALTLAGCSMGSGMALSTSKVQGYARDVATTLSARIAQIRTWTFAANRPDWLADPEHWQAVTRAVEDRLSDALHERLIERFVDRRTSVLMRRLRENSVLNTEIGKTGEVIDVAVAAAGACLLTAEFEVYCWGSNLGGALGQALDHEHLPTSSAPVGPVVFGPFE